MPIKKCLPGQYFDRQEEKCLTKPKCRGNTYFDEEQGKCVL